jgi:hypothetical protein
MLGSFINKNNCSFSFITFSFLIVSYCILFCFQF